MVWCGMHECVLRRFSDLSAVAYSLLAPSLPLTHTWNRYHLVFLVALYRIWQTTDDRRLFMKPNRTKRIWKWKFMSKCVVFGEFTVRTHGKASPTSLQETKLIQSEFDEMEMSRRFDYEKHLSSAINRASQLVFFVSTATATATAVATTERTNKRAKDKRWRALQLCAHCHCCCCFLWSYFTNECNIRPEWKWAASVRVDIGSLPLAFVDVCLCVCMCRISLHNTIARVAKWYAFIHEHAHHTTPGDGGFCLDEDVVETQRGTSANVHGDSNRRYTQ